MPVNYRLPNLIVIGGLSGKLSEIKGNGQSFHNLDALKTWISANLFKSGGGSGEGATTWDELNGKPTGTDRQVIGFVGGDMQAVTLGWKQFSDLPSVPPFNNGVLAGTAFNENGDALFAFIELATNGNKSAAIPLYKTNGRLSVGNATQPDDAICLGQINGVLKSIHGYNSSLSQTLKHVNGELQWV